MNKNTYILAAVLFFGFCFKSYSQFYISGSVINHKEEGIAFVSVTSSKDSLSTVSAYTATDRNGNFRLTIKEKGEYSITFSSLGYTSVVQKHQVSENQVAPIIVRMQEESYQLDEVILTADLPIQQKKDTITFDAAYFLTGTEQVVEDLLRKIPGISISDEGIIKVQGKEIEKLMVDGDDLFESGYQVLSKSMPVRPIDKVEVLNKYSNNKLLKDIEFSDRVAINLQLKDEFKRVWFGDIELGYSPENDYYQTKFNLANFGKVNKYYFIGNANNTGVDAIGDINRLIHPYKEKDDPGSIGNNEYIKSLIDLSTEELSFGKERTNFNQDKLITLNSIFNPSENLQIKALLFFNNAHNDFYRDRYSNINSEGVSFNNEELYRLKNKTQTSFGKLEFKYDLSANNMLETITRYSYNTHRNRSDLNFNKVATNESLAYNNHLIDQEVKYTHKIDAANVLLLTTRFKHQKEPQKYHVDKFLLKDLFPNSEQANNLSQETDVAMKYAGIKAHLLSRSKSNQLIELQVGNEFREDKIDSDFILWEENSIINIPEGFQNDMRHQRNDLYAKSSYRYSLGNISFTAKANLHQYLIKSNTREAVNKQNPLYINPAILMDWELNDKNKLVASYSYNKTNLQAIDMYEGYVMSGLRNFNKGSKSFQPLTASQVFVNYTLGNWNERFLINSFLVYTKNHDFLSSSTSVAQNHVLTEKVLIKDRWFVSLNTSADYYLKFMASNIKANFGYQESNYKNIVNSFMQEVSATNYNYGLELRSGFLGAFNYHLGTKWITTEIRTKEQKRFTDQVSFLNLSLALQNGLSVQLEAEHYYLGALQTKKEFKFLNIDVRYTIPNSKLDLAIEAKNIFNTKKFTAYHIDDISSITTEYSLLPRMLLLKATHRF